MASEVYTTLDVKFEDGSEATVKPLVIGKLRKFMKVWNDWIESVTENEVKRDANERAEREDEKKPNKDVLSMSDINDKQYEIYLDLADICLRTQLKENKSDDVWRQWLEDNVDLESLYRILDKCGGLKLDNENLTNQMDQMETE